MPLCMIEFLVLCTLFPPGMRLLHPCFRRPYLRCDTTAAAGRWTSPRNKGTGASSCKPGRSRQARAIRCHPAKNAGHIDLPCTITPVPYRLEKTNQARSRNWSTSWILPFCGGRFRLGWRPRARPFDGWTLPKSLWIGQGHD